MSVARTFEKDLEQLKNVFKDYYNIIDKVIGYNDMTIGKLQEQNVIFKKLQTSSNTVLSKFRKTRKRPGKKTPSPESISRSPTKKSKSQTRKSISPPKNVTRKNKHPKGPTVKIGRFDVDDATEDETEDYTPSP